MINSYTNLISTKLLKRLCSCSFFLFLLTVTGCQHASNLPEGFVYASDVIPDLEVDLRYAGTDNFIGRPVKGYRSSQLILSLEAAKALATIQITLKPKRLGLKVFDGYRPQQAVNDFITWSEMDSDTLMKSKYYPNLSKSILFSSGYISKRSGHSRGSTVDLTLIYLDDNRHGKELDMGTGWDYFSPESGWKASKLSEEQEKNRWILRTHMENAGFKAYTEEWWHYTLINEPFPDTYFDFPVH